MDTRIISIGTLAAHPLWGERSAVRTGHATTTLIRSGDRVILVDPGLPVQVLAARLAERANVKMAAVTHIFLTSFHPDARRALPAFDHAAWWIHESEREQVGVPLALTLKEAAEAGDEELVEMMRQEISLLKRCEAAPDELAPGVDLFPLPGVTPGMCGLLLEEPTRTTLICGDAIPTIEHLEQGKVLPSAHDIVKARESFGEAIEIADVLILGRDNLVPNPTKRPF